VGKEERDCTCTDQQEKTILAKAGKRTVKTSVPMYQTTRHHVPEDTNIETNIYKHEEVLWN